MKIAFRPIVAAALLLTLALPAACNKSPTSSGIQPQVANNPDDFAYQVSNVRGYTGGETYTWQNSGTGASVNQATSISSGFMTLTISDAGGALVYQRSLSDNGTFPSTVGAAGAWTVRIDYARATGTVNFRVQKI